MNKTKKTGICRRMLAVASALGSLLAVGGPVASPAGAVPVRDGQWYLQTMGAERMWEKTTGQGVTVAVVDGGIRSSQAELKGRVLRGKSFWNDKEDPGNSDKAESHGTTMAALIAGDSPDGQGIKGLAPGARILPVKVGIDHISTTAPIAKAIRYAADSDAKIISMSIGMTEAAATDKSKAELQSAVDYAVKRGKLLFAGTGNDGRTTNVPSYPGATRGVVGVSALDSDLQMAKFSTHGPQVALAAPGMNIPTLCDKPSGYCHGQGTSQATALASASAALVWSLHPEWTGNQVLRVLLDTAGRPPHGKVPSDYVGYGMIRPRVNVTENKGNPGPRDVNPLVAAAEKSEKSSAKGATPTAPVTHEPAGVTGKKSKAKGKDDNLPWFIGGAIAVAVPGAVLVALMVRRGRRKARARKQQAQSAVAAGPYGGTTPVDPAYPAPPPQPPQGGGGRPPGGS